MDPATLSDSELSKAYLKHHETRTDSDFWAWEEIQKRVLWGEDPLAAWRLVQTLVSAAGDDALGYVAAGPLEDLVTAHAPALIHEIEAKARKDSKFREFLSLIWLSEGDLPPDILTRVVAASNHRIRPLPSCLDDPPDLND